MRNQEDSDTPSDDARGEPIEQRPVSPTTPEKGAVGEKGNANSNNKDDVSNELRKVRWVEPAQIGINVTLVVVGIIALWIYTAQLYEMRKSNKAAQDAADAAKSAAETAQNALKIDERAWLQFEMIGDTAPNTQGVVPGLTLHLNPGLPVLAPVRFTNIGQTVARHIHIDIAVDIIDSSKEIPNEIIQPGYPYRVIETNLMFPHVPIQLSVGRRQIGQNGFADRPLTVDEVTALQKGNAYIAVYGIARYDDIFKTSHWLKFCQSAFLAKEGCTRYNEADENK